MSLGNLLDAAEAKLFVDSGKSVNAEKIEICHVASGDRWAGAEMQLATLLRALQDRDDFIVSAILLNEGRLADEARQCGVEVGVVPESERNFLQILLAASRFLHGRKVRILHSHRYKENLLAAVLARRCGVPFLVRSQHGAPEYFTGWRHLKQGFTQVLDRVVARYAFDFVIGVSNELGNQLTRYLPASKVAVIHNGIETEKVFSSFGVPEAKKRLGIPAECSVLGTAGRLDRVKRLDIFLAAAQQIAACQPNARFVIAGEGEEESRLRRLAQALRLQERVLFLGHRTDIYDVLRAMDIFVLCSDHEGLPMVLLEALCLGVAVVARPVGGIPEAIQDGVNAVLVDSAEPSALASACLRILADKEGRKRMVQAGTQRVAEKFSAEQTAAEVAQLYRSLSDAR